MYDIVIIGAGPAGLTAAIYAGRAGKKVLLLEKNVCYYYPNTYYICFLYI